MNINAELKIIVCKIDSETNTEVVIDEYDDISEEMLQGLLDSHDSLKLYPIMKKVEVIEKEKTTCCKYFIWDIDNSITVV